MNFLDRADLVMFGLELDFAVGDTGLGLLHPGEMPRLVNETTTNGVTYLRSIPVRDRCNLVRGIRVGRALQNRAHKLYGFNPRTETYNLRMY